MTRGRIAGRTTPATARLNANSFIDWISKSPSFDSCSTFSRASHNPHSHLRHISTLFTPADRERKKESRSSSVPHGCFPFYHSAFLAVFHPLLFSFLCSTGVTADIRDFFGSACLFFRTPSGSPPCISSVRFSFKTTFLSVSSAPGKTVE